MTQSFICSAECRRRKRVQRYCKFLTFATFWAEKCVAKCRLFVPPDSHAITRSRRAKFGLLKKFFTFLPKNLHICNLVSIKQLRGTFDAPFCPYCAPSPYLSDIGDSEWFCVFFDQKNATPSELARFSASLIFFFRIHQRL